MLQNNANTLKDAQGATVATDMKKQEEAFAAASKVFEQTIQKTEDDARMINTKQTATIKKQEQDITELKEALNQTLQMTVAYASKTTSEQATTNKEHGQGITQLKKLLKLKAQKGDELAKFPPVQLLVAWLCSFWLGVWTPPRRSPEDMVKLLVMMLQQCVCGYFARYYFDSEDDLGSIFVILTICSLVGALYASWSGVPRGIRGRLTWTRCAAV
jgi:hypothetical protein